MVELEILPDAAMPASTAIPVPDEQPGVVVDVAVISLGSRSDGGAR